MKHWGTSVINSPMSPPSLLKKYAGLSGMEGWAVNYTSTQSIIKTFSYLLAEQLWGLYFDFNILTTYFNQLNR